MRVRVSMGGRLGQRQEDAGRRHFQQNGLGTMSDMATVYPNRHVSRTGAPHTWRDMMDAQDRTFLMPIGAGPGRRKHRGASLRSASVFSPATRRATGYDEKCGEVQPTNAGHAARRRSGGLSLLLAPWLQVRRPSLGERRCARSPVAALVNGRVRAATLSGSATWQEGAALKARPGLIDQAPTFDDDAARRVAGRNTIARSADRISSCQDPRYIVLIKVRFGACLSSCRASA